jgi:hypothetical protein
MKLLHTPRVKLKARSPRKIKSTQVARAKVVTNEFIQNLVKSLSVHGHLLL